MKPERVAGLVLAAGRSSRMGTRKLLLPVGDGVVLERGIRMYRQAGIRDVRVVVGHCPAALDPVLRKHDVRRIDNENYDKGMFSSVQAGVGSFEEGIEGFFVLPADVPLVRPRTVLDLLEAFQRHSTAVVRPVFSGEAGHPVLLAGRLAPDLLHWTGTGGLRSFLQEGGFPAVDVEVADENVLFDLDTPADYEELRMRFLRYGIPSPRECRLLLHRKFALEERLLGHVKAVTRAALRLGRALIRGGHPLDVELLLAAGLLHDVARDRPNHAEAGARILRELGYGPVADVVASHMDIVLGPGAPIREKEILYLADKLVQGDRFAGLAERFRVKGERFQGDPEAAGAIALRLENAERIRARLEEMLGVSPETFLEDRHAGRTDDLLVAAWGDGETGGGATPRPGGRPVE